MSRAPTTATATTSRSSTATGSTTQSLTRTATLTRLYTYSQTASPLPSVDWLQHGMDARRSFVNSNEAVLTPGTVPGLLLKWRASIFGATIGSPLLVHGVAVAGGATIDLVLSGTEAGTLYALDASSGAIVWSRNLGFTSLACGDLPANSWGIGGTPLVLKAPGVVYVSSQGVLRALRLADGSDVVGFSSPMLFDKTLLHNYGGLAYWDGAVYVAAGGECDNGVYRGSIYRVSATTGQLLSVSASEGTGPL